MKAESSCLLRLLLRSLPALCILATSARAQSVILRWNGDDTGDGLGASFATLPDVNGDGVPEVLVGEIWGDCCGTDWGAAYVFSGKDGSTYLTECGSGTKFGGDAFGRASASIGDVDGDGFADVVIGAPNYYSSLGNGAGRVCVFSGSSGALLYQVEGEEQGIGLGWAVAGIGDVDGDGRSDFLIGAPGFAYVYPPSIGRAYVRSGAAGALIRYHEGEEAYDQFGWNVAGLGDVDADGVPDYGMMAMYDPAVEYGAVYVFSGASGNPLYKWTGVHGFDFFGYGLDGHLDWNRDGYGDILVGAPVNLYSDGYVYVYSGKDGSLLATVVGEEYGTQFGYSVANVGDMNGDGYPEILVGERLNSELNKYSGRATLLDGRTLRRVYHFYGAGLREGYFGIKVAGGEDYNGDGIPDVIITEDAGTKAAPRSGRVTIFAGNDLFLQAIPDAVTAGDALVVDTRGGAPDALALLVLLDVSGTSCFIPLQLTTLDSNGEMELSATVPSGLSGITLTLQSFAQRSAGHHGFADSDKETVSLY